MRVFGCHGNILEARRRGYPVFICHVIIFADYSNTINPSRGGTGVAVDGSKKPFPFCKSEESNL
jgi:hypothetical protein